MSYPAVAYHYWDKESLHKNYTIAVMLIYMIHISVSLKAQGCFLILFGLFILLIISYLYFILNNDQFIMLLIVVYLASL